MARTDRAQQKTAVEDSTVDTDGPALRDGHDQIVEEAPGVGPAAEMIPPVGGAVLFDGVDPVAFDGVDGEALAGVDPVAFDGVDGESFGSTLLEDLGAGSDLPDPTGGIDGMGSDGGGVPIMDDQSGWAMDLPSGLSPRQGGDIYDDDDVEHQDGAEPQSDDDEEEIQNGNSGDDPDDGTSEDVGQTPGNYGTPAPDDGTGGDPEAGDFIGGRGDVDPPPETQNHGGGDLIGGRGDVDPDPDLDDAGEGGTIDLERLGVGVIDPLNGESTLLGGDTGDLAEMAATADLGDVEIEFDDSLADADIGDDV